jgi:2-iminobutanoate/2-iminopropanoate deaminase
MIKRIQPNAVPESDAPFSQIVLDDCYAYLSGLVAADFPQGLAVLGDVGAETSIVMSVISDMLSEVGLNLEDVVKAEVHLADLNDFAAMDAAYQEHFPSKGYPARTTTESPKLFGGSRVEVTVQARFRDVLQKGSQERGG